MTDQCDRYALPDYAEALFFGLMREIHRVYWNVNQCEWQDQAPTSIPGLETHPYWWGGEEDPEAALPNFAFHGVELRWYKHPGRSMSANVKWPPDKWAAWFDTCLKAIRGFELKKRE